MSNLPNIKQLYYFVTLFEQKHFGRAALACHISQSTLSASITNLEEKLGAQLLERDHKTFIFTQLGQEIVKRSRIILEDCQNIQDLAAYQAKPMAGNVFIGCIPTIAPFLVSELMNKSKRHFPELSIKLKEETTENGLKSLELGELDLLILALPYETSQFHTRIIAKDPFKLTLHKDWLNKTFNEEISQWPDESIFLLQQEHCLTGHALNACQLKDKKKINSFFATSLHTLKELVNNQQGVTFMPELAISSGILNGTDLTTLNMKNQTGYRELGIAWRKTTTRQQTFRALGDLMAEIFHEKGLEPNKG